MNDNSPRTISDAAAGGASARQRSADEIVAFEFERLLSGRGLAGAGILLILIGCAFFLDLSLKLVAKRRRRRRVDVLCDLRVRVRDAAAAFGGAFPLHLLPFAAVTALYIAALGYIFAASDSAAANPHALGATLLGLTAILLCAPRVRRFPRELAGTSRSFAGIAFNLGLHALLGRSELFDAFALEGAALVALGKRGHSRVTAFVGLALLATAGAGLAFDAFTIAPQDGLFTPLALGFLMFATSAFSLRRTIPEECRAVGALLGHLVVFTGLCRVVLDATGGPDWTVALPNVSLCALSIAAAGFATLLFGQGIAIGSRVRRWEGLALFGATIVKVFTFDLAGLDITYRSVAFVGIGVLLFVSSAAYLRFAHRTAGALPEQIAA